MSAHERRITLDRRAFLGTLGLAVGALAIDPQLLLASHAPPATEVGLPRLLRPLAMETVLPQSSIHPDLGRNWLDGLNLYFGQAGGAGVRTLEVGQASKSLAARQGGEVAGQPGLVTGIVGPGVGCLLARALDPCCGVLVASEAGANVTRQDEMRGNAFHSTLGYWQGNWAMGRWAATNLGRRAFVACSFYESGYDSLYAFRRGFETAGGQVVGMQVTGVPPRDDGLPVLMSAIARARPDLVYGLYSGPQAVDFVRAYAAAGLTRRIPLAGSAFMVDERIVGAMGDAALGIKSALGWAPTLETPERKAFTTAFAQATGRAADGFAALGYDTARLIAEGLRAVGGSAGDGSALQSALAAVRFSGPRGPVQMDAATHLAVAPLYLREVRRSGEVLVNEVLGELAPVAEDDEGLAGLRQAVRSGWTHAYLCV